jgi:hypothetical protein
MSEGKRSRLSLTQRSEIWSRWKSGQSLHEIGRAFGKPHSCIRCLLLPRGGIAPALRRRSRLAVRWRRIFTALTLAGVQASCPCHDATEEETLSSPYTFGGNFHLVDPTERKEQSNEILRRVLRGLLDDITDRVRDGGVEGYRLDLHAREVDPDELTRLERRFHRHL